MPFLGKIAAHGLVFAAHAGQFYGGIGEVKVGMFPLPEHGPGVGDRGRNGVSGFVTGKQIAGKRHGKRHLACPLWTAEEQCVRQSVFLHHLHEPAADRILSYDIRKVHLPSCFMLLCYCPVMQAAYSRPSCRSAASLCLLCRRHRATKVANKSEKMESKSERNNLRGRIFSTAGNPVPNSRESCSRRLGILFPTAGNRIP